MKLKWTVIEQGIKPSEVLLLCSLVYQRPSIEKVEMKQIIACIAIATALSSPVIAADSDTAAKKEIEHLMRHLASSGCQFNRNGSWYSASRAMSHLNRKYQYLLEQKLVLSAEAFIDRAASKSSTSGKPYLVKCSGQSEVESTVWFRAELAKLRKESSNAANPH